MTSLGKSAVKPTQVSETSPDKPVEEERFAVTICEIIGYTSIMIWIPYILLADSFKPLEISLTFPVDIPLASLSKMLCLLVCAFLGFTLRLFADAFNSKKRYMALCIGALVSAIVAFFIPFTLVKILLMAVGFSCCYAVWSLYLLNKKLKGTSLLISLLCSGCLLVISCLLESSSALLMTSVIVLVSVMAFLAVSDECFRSWIFSPKESMQKRGFSFSQHIFPIIISGLFGVSMGTMLSSGGSFNALILIGASFILAFGGVFLLTKIEKKPSRSFLRGMFAVSSCCLIVILAVLQGFAQALTAAALAAFLITDKYRNQFSHIKIAKDTTLSEPFLSGYRLMTASLGVMVGFLASAWIVAMFPAPSNPHFAFFGFLACILFFGCLINLNVFSAKKERLPVAKIVDPWHEKVILVAQDMELSPRQTEIFDALSRGRNTKYIMQRLFLSEGTVKKQIFQIYKRIGAHTQQELITLVMNTSLDRVSDPSDSVSKKEKV